jgi:hypothetical protein
VKSVPIPSTVADLDVLVKSAENAASWIEGEWSRGGSMR